MASLRVDSELMTNYVSALPVKAGSKFVTCLDPISRRPMVFGISTDTVPVLNVVKEDETGQPQTINFGALLGIPATVPVRAFDCQQANDLSVNLVVAVGADTSDYSNIYVVKPFQLSNKPVVTVLPVHATKKVYTINLGPADTGYGYPTILLTHRAGNSFTVRTDITRLLVDPSLTTWTALRDMELPTNVTTIDSLAPAANAYGRGLYALCTVQGTAGPEKKIIGEFARFDTDQNDGSLFWFNTQIVTPQDATCIATFTDARGRSCLLIGGAIGVRYLKCSEATNKYSSGRMLISSISTNTFGAVSLEIAQDADKVTIWSLGSSGSLSYAYFSLSDLDKGGGLLPVTLLNAGVTSFSASISRPGIGPTSQTLVTIDKSGNLTILAQSLDTRLWKPQLLYSSSTAKNIPFTSYSINIQPVDVKGQPLPNGRVKMCASSQINALINGGWQTLTTKPADYTLDFTGELAIIIATDTIASPKFSILGVYDSTGNDARISSLTFDPSLKVLDQIDHLGFADANKIKSVTNASAEDAKNAADALSQMRGVCQELRGQTAVQAASTNADPVAEFLSYIKEKANEAKNFFIQKANDVWTLVCKFVDQSITFVLDTVEKIGEGVTLIFKKLGMAFETIKNLFGFLFNMDDILATKTTIVGCLNHFLDFTKNGVESLLPQIDDLFEGWKRNLNASKAKDFSSVDQTVANNAQSSAMDSTQMKWCSERLKNGGAITGVSISKTKDHSGDPDLANIFNNEVKNVFNTIKGFITGQNDGIRNAFTAGNLKTIGDVMKNVSIEGLISVLEVLRIAVKAIVRFLAKLIVFFKDFGNWNINIPIFSDLYYTLTGNSLTLFEGVSFILAIPATIITKLVAKKSPPKIGDVNFDMFDRTFASNASGLVGHYSSSTTTQGQARAAGAVAQQQQTAAKTTTPTASQTTTQATSQTPALLVAGQANNTKPLQAVDTSSKTGQTGNLLWTGNRDGQAPLMVDGGGQQVNTGNFASGIFIPGQPPPEPTTPPGPANPYAPPVDPDVWTERQLYDLNMAIIKQAWRDSQTPEQLDQAKKDGTYLWSSPSEIQALDKYNDQVKRGVWEKYRPHDNTRSDLDKFKDTMSTLGSALAASILVLKPAFSMYSILKAGSDEAELSAVSPKAFIRGATLVAAIVTGAVTLSTPKGDWTPIALPYLLNGLGSIVYGGLGALFSIAGNLDIGDSMETVYQYIQLAFKTIQFALNVTRFALEIVYIDDPSQKGNNDLHCVGFGLASSVFGVASDALNFAGYMLVKDPETEAVGVGCYLAGTVPGLGAGVTAVARFGMQAGLGYLPTVTLQY